MRSTYCRQHIRISNPRQERSRRFSYTAQSELCPRQSRGNDHWSKSPSLSCRLSEGEVVGRLVFGIPFRPYHIWQRTCSPTLPRVPRTSANTAGLQAPRQETTRRTRWMQAHTESRPPFRSRPGQAAAKLSPRGQRRRKRDLEAPARPLKSRRAGMADSGACAQHTRQSLRAECRDRTA